MWYRTCHFRISEVGETMSQMAVASKIQMCVPAAVFFLLALFVGCSRSTVLQNTDSASASDSGGNSRLIPFHSGDPASGAQADANSATAANGGAGEPRKVPFAVASGNFLPAGTFLTVRLDETLSNGKSGSGPIFTGVVQDGLSVAGNILVARGTAVRGQVESIGNTTFRGRQPFARLTLVSLRLDGRDVAMNTSSLFVRGQTDLGYGAHKATFTPLGAQSSVRIPKGRLLTFRLSSPMSIPASESASLSKKSASNGN